MAFYFALLNVSSKREERHHRREHEQRRRRHSIHSIDDNKLHDYRLLPRPLVVGEAAQGGRDESEDRDEDRGDRTHGTGRSAREREERRPHNQREQSEQPTMTTRRKKKGARGKRDESERDERGTEGMHKKRRERRKEKDPPSERRRNQHEHEDSDDPSDVDQPGSSHGHHQHQGKGKPDDTHAPGAVLADRDPTPTRVEEKEVHCSSGSKTTDNKDNHSHRRRRKSHESPNSVHAHNNHNNHSAEKDKDCKTGSAASSRRTSRSSHASHANDSPLTATPHNTLNPLLEKTPPIKKVTFDHKNEALVIRNTFLDDRVALGASVERVGNHFPFLPRLSHQHHLSHSREIQISGDSCGSLCPLFSDEDEAEGRSLLRRHSRDVRLVGTHTETTSLHRRILRRRSTSDKERLELEFWNAGYRGKDDELTTEPLSGGVLQAQERKTSLKTSRDIRMTASMDEGTVYKEERLSNTKTENEETK